MRKIFTLFATCFCASTLFAQTTFHDFSPLSITLDTIHLSQYYGKKVMVVNTASFCVYTPQFTDLQSLYSQYNQYNFEIIGFPCNDFNHQDPNSDSAIQEVCNGYNVTFQMMDKIHTVSGNIAPVYQWLEHQSQNGVSNATVSWNFNKFLIDEAGHWVRHFDSPTNPLDTAITNWILSPSVIQTNNIASVSSDELIHFTSANPSNTSIDFSIKNLSSQQFNIGLFSMQGQLVKTLYNGTPADNQSISYSVSSLPSGVYFLHIQAGSQQSTVKYVVMD